MNRLLSVHLFRADLRTRLPFRSGIATMTELPHVFWATEWELDGQPASGLTSENLPPKWFTKEAERDPLEVIGEMEAVLAKACQAAGEIVSTKPFDFWLALYGGVMKPSSAPLLQHLGVALVERSLLDAVCRHHATPLWQLVREDRLGLDLGKLSPELAGRKPSEFLPSRPQSTATLRHTVGMADPLHESDIPGGRALTMDSPNPSKPASRRMGCGNSSSSSVAMRKPTSPVCAPRPPCSRKNAAMVSPSASMATNSSDRMDNSTTSVSA